MKTGISTASLYGKMYTEEALEFFAENGVEYAEVFLSSFSEYTQDFGKKLKSVQGNVKVNSIHTLNSQFEGQLFAHSVRQYEDALVIFKNALAIGKELGAKIYVMHGPAQMKYTKYVTDYDFFALRTAELAKISADYGITLTWENVHWTHYNHPDFFKNIISRTDADICATLDIKQAQQSDTTVDKYIADMSGRIKNLHVVDFDENGRLTLPGWGKYDYKSLLRKMGNYDGPMIIEVYDGCYGDPKELIQSYNLLKDLLKE